jgi:hypothetical protein
MWWRGVFQNRYAAAFDERQVAGACTNALLQVSESLWFLISQRLLLAGKTGADASKFTAPAGCSATRPPIRSEDEL